MDVLWYETISQYTDYTYDMILERDLKYEGDVTTGWSALARTIREIDEEKIRGCKEDVDTLLVFVSASSRSTNSA